MGADEETGGGAGGNSPSGIEGREIVPRDAAPKPYRARHDGFTAAKQRKFFKTLRKTGCIADACRACGISRNTIRRWRDRWPEFDGKVEAALALASAELDAIAWKRATVGTEEKVYRDGQLVFTRVKQSDAMLRLLMQGADPGKYGRTGQLPKRAVMKQLRKEAKAEVLAKLRPSEEELVEALMIQFDALERRLARRKSEGRDEDLPPPDGS